MHYTQSDSPNFSITQVKEKLYKKDREAFTSRSGVCYTDKDGKEYTYQDLYNIVLSEKGAEELFEELTKDTVEESLNDSWHFRKCPRCGNWIYNETIFSGRRSAWICNFCTPIKSHGVIQIENNPYDDDRNFFRKRKVQFEPGVTTLIGCNGIGKSTLLRNIEEKLKSEGVPVFFFDNMSQDGGGKIAANELTKALWGNTGEEALGYAVGLFSQSEGERIRSALVNFAGTVAHKFDAYRNYGEYWVLFDAIDSGLSLDVLEDVKEYFFKTMMEKIPENKDIYIICSSNSYEFSEDTQIFSVEKMRYVSVKSYDKYKSVIKSSIERKRERDDVFRVKREIYQLPCSWKIDEEAIEKYENRGDVKADAFILECENYRMTIILKKKDYASQIFTKLEKKKGDKYVEISCKDFEGIDGWKIRKDEVKEDMHDYVCQRIFRDRKRKGKKS